MIEFETTFRQRVRKRFSEDVPYYIELSGETTEVATDGGESQAPRSARRRRQRMGAEYREWIQKGRDVVRVKLNTLRAAVDKYPCVILLGDPGCGKTTAFQQLAYEVAGEDGRLPLPLRLSEFAPKMSMEDFIANGWGGAVNAGHWNAFELADNLTGYLDDGKLFCLFDALNEMPHEGYGDRARALRSFINTWSSRGNRFLVTCRVLDYGGESPYGCLDMAGNVWEWTSSLWGKDIIKSEYKYSYKPGDERENLEADDEIRRVLRGGSWGDYRFFARCSFRGRANPNLRYDARGFRVLVSPISAL